MGISKQCKLHFFWILDQWQSILDRPCIASEVLIFCRSLSSPTLMWTSKISCLTLSKGGTSSSRSLPSTCVRAFCFIMCDTMHCTSEPQKLMRIEHKCSSNITICIHHTHLRRFDDYIMHWSRFQDIIWPTFISTARRTTTCAHSCNATWPETKRNADRSVGWRNLYW